MSNWDNDGYYDDDAWFQAVTYDQTDYQDVDGYLEPEAVPSQAAAGLSAGRVAEDPAWDRYAGYDEFGYLASQPAPPLETAPGQAPPAGEAWAPQAAPWERPPASDSRVPGPAPGQQPAPLPRPEHDQPGHLVNQPAPPPPGEGHGQQGYLVSQPVRPPETDAFQEQPPPPDETWVSGLEDPYGAPRPPAVARRPGWLLLGISAVAAAAVGFGLVMITHRGTPSLPSSALPPATASPRASGSLAPGRPARPAATSGAPITPAQAQQVLADYTTTNNTANAQVSPTLLATVEAGSSFAIDNGIYDAKQATHANGYPAYSPASASYYIPLESPATYPHWFAVRVANALLSAPGKVVQTEYLVFTQAAAGAPWLNSLEPFTLASATLPSVALGASGYATAVSSSGTSLALPAATASATTATALDSGTGQPANPGNLADENDLASFRKNLSPLPSITSRHSATTDAVFGLRTTNGGALLFYDVAAQLTLTAAPGSTLRADIPGFVSPGAPASKVTLNYLEQFAVNDPPAGQGMPAQVIADYSGLTGSAG